MKKLLIVFLFLVGCGKDPSLLERCRWNAAVFNMGACRFVNRTDHPVTQCGKVKLDCGRRVSHSDQICVRNLRPGGLYRTDAVMDNLSITYYEMGNNPRMLNDRCVMSWEQHEN